METSFYSHNNNYYESSNTVEWRVEREKISSQTSCSGECDHPQFDLEQGTHHMTLYSQHLLYVCHMTMTCTCMACKLLYTCRNTFTLYTCTCNKQYINIIIMHHYTHSSSDCSRHVLCEEVTVYSLAGGSHDANSGSSSSAASFFYTHMIV